MSGQDCVDPRAVRTGGVRPKIWLRVDPVGGGAGQMHHQVDDGCTQSSMWAVNEHNPIGRHQNVVRIEIEVHQRRALCGDEAVGLATQRGVTGCRPPTSRPCRVARRAPDRRRDRSSHRAGDARAEVQAATASPSRLAQPWPARRGSACGNPMAPQAERRRLPRTRELPSDRHRTNPMNAGAGTDAGNERATIASVRCAPHSSGHASPSIALTKTRRPS